MNERPILFSGAMVRAILAGAKTQTRRVAKLQPRSRADIGHYGPGIPFIRNPDPAGKNTKCPYGRPGERLWVRETHAARADCWGRWQESEFRGRNVFGPGELCYAADGGDPFIERWRPSIHMPRWASRILLEVTHVRVEHLQDISEADVVAEGASTPGPFARHHFMDLWTSINGADSWNADPWVWAVEFRRLEPKGAAQGPEEIGGRT